MKVNNISFSTLQINFKLFLFIVRITTITLIIFAITKPAFSQNAHYTDIQDTLKMDLQQAEKTFLDSNLELIAMYYNIQSNKALIEQARKWENPDLSTSQNLFTKEGGQTTGKFFQHGRLPDGSMAGEYFFDVEQLIKTAGKRGKQIDIAKTNTTLAEWQFKATMRQLRLTLITDFYTVDQLQGNARLFEENRQRLEVLLRVMKMQLDAGNIATKEYLRVQALLVSQQQDIAENSKSLADAESELKSTLRIKGNHFIQPVVPAAPSDDFSNLSLMHLLDTAMIYNTDYQTELYQLQLQNQTLRLQRSLAVPDVTAGVSYDQQASYVPYYYALNIGIPLPLWDRNQGNIKSAKYSVKQEEANMQQADLKLQNDVINAYQKLIITSKVSVEHNKHFYEDYYKLFNNISEAYDKRQISLLEFLDYFGDYEDTRQRELQQRLDLFMAKAELNDVVGTDIAK